MIFGTRVFAAGIIALGLVCLAAQDFVLSQGLPDNFAYRAALADVGGAFAIVAGAAVAWPRATRAAAAALTAFYAVIVLGLIDVPFIVANAREYGTYSNVAEDFALAAAALIIYATAAGRDARLVRGAQMAFGICAILFGGAHFLYLNLTVPLVPKYLPPSQEFWAYATGVAHIAAGVALLTGVRARLAAVLLTIMYASFTPLVHVPLFLSDPTRHFYWSENALNVALAGAAWVVADSLRSRRVMPQPRS
jgi:uncharacterized membrane protein YphA (DoxX/SURF4 family)